MAKSLSKQAELAIRAGVSQATVSRCLRNDPMQHRATRERVQALAREMGYVPNSFAAGLAHTRHAGGQPAKANLAIIGGNEKFDPAKQFRNWTAFVEAAKRRAEDLGYSMEYLWRYQPGMTARRLRQIIEARGIFGLILMMISSPEEMDLPWDRLALAATKMPHQHPLTHYVGTNPYHDTCLALQECRKLGYKRPGLATQLTYDLHQYEGAVTAAFLLHNHGLPAADRIPLANTWSGNFSYRQFLGWIDRHRPDVILTTDALAGEYLRRSGRRIPEEMGFVSLAGKDFGLMENSSCVDQRNDLSGMAAVEIVTGQLHHNERGLPEHPRCVIVPSEWRAGSTTRVIE